MAVGGNSIHLMTTTKKTRTMNLLTSHLRHHSRHHRHGGNQRGIDLVRHGRRPRRRLRPGSLTSHRINLSCGIRTRCGRSSRSFGQGKDLGAYGRARMSRSCTVCCSKRLRRGCEVCCQRFSICQIPECCPCRVPVSVDWISLIARHRLLRSASR